MIRDRLKLPVVGLAVVLLASCGSTDDKTGAAEPDPCAKPIAQADRLNDQIGTLTGRVGYLERLASDPDAPNGSEYWVAEWQAAQDELDATLVQMSRLIIDNDICFSNTLVLEAKRKLGFVD